MARPVTVITAAWMLVRDDPPAPEFQACNGLLTDVGSPETHTFLSPVYETPA